MAKWIGKILVTVLGLALLVYSSIRSVSFIQLTLSSDKQMLAFFGLAALDGGIIVWLCAFLYGSHGGAQRGLSIIMVIVDFLGAVAMFTADTAFNTGKSGLTVAFDQNEMMGFILVLSAIIALNIGAGIAHHIADPDNMRRMADEEAFGKIEELARKKVSEESDFLAAELAPTIAASWSAQTRAKYMHALNDKKVSTPLLPPTIRTPVKTVTLEPEELELSRLEKEYRNSERSNGKGKQKFQQVEQVSKTAPFEIHHD